MADILLSRRDPKAPLTAAEVAAIKPPAEGRIVVRDPGCRGLTLRVSASGARSWSVEVKNGKTQKRITLGDAYEISLAKARSEAMAKRVDYKERGVDPAKERRERQRAEAQQREDEKRRRKAQKAGGTPTDTVRGLLDQFEKRKAKPAGLRSWPDMRKMIEFNFGSLLDQTPNDLSRADLLLVLDNAMVDRKAPISGKRAVRYLGRVYGWALKKDLVAANPAAGLDLNELVRPERSRSRVLTNDEIRAVWKAATDSGAPFGDLCRLYLLTGLRREEGAGMKWSDLDGDTLALAATKTDEPHRLPLSRAAVGIVRAQPKRKARRHPSDGSEAFVFALSNGAPMAGKHTNWCRENRRLITAAGTAPWTWHDLRRTCRTTLAGIGVDDLVAELILNHALPGQLRRTYNLHRYQGEMRTALEQLALFIRLIVAGADRTRLELAIELFKAGKDIDRLDVFVDLAAAAPQIDHLRLFVARLKDGADRADLVMLKNQIIAGELANVVPLRAAG